MCKFSVTVLLMLLEEIYNKYNILNKLRYGLIEKGYSIQVISYLNGQIDLLNKLITKESFNVENRTVYKGSQQCYNEA